MALWGIVELTITAISTYSLVRGAYNMYRDAEAIKEEYRSYQTTTEEYRIAQSKNFENPLTESQYNIFEKEFTVLKSDRSASVGASGGGNVGGGSGGGGSMSKPEPRSKTLFPECVPTLELLDNPLDETELWNSTPPKLNYG